VILLKSAWGDEISKRCALGELKVKQFERKLLRSENVRGLLSWRQYLLDDEKLILSGLGAQILKMYWLREEIFSLLQSESKTSKRSMSDAWSGE